MKNCKICFKLIKENNFVSFFNHNLPICIDCLNSLDLKMHKFKLEGIKCIALYDYNETLQSLLFQFKGCYDYELKDVFINRIKKELKIMFHNYKVIPIPSHDIEDQKRGFNHVVEIFKNLDLPMLNILKKIENIKQSSLTKSERKKSIKNLYLSDLDKIKNEKILIVDDVYTTGSTLKAAINLIKENKPKDIKVLVVSKTIYKPLNRKKC